MTYEIPRVLGIDPSLTSSGYAYRDGDRYITGRIRTLALRGSERVCFVRDSVQSLLDAVEPTIIVYEGYAMGVRNSRGRTYDIGELGGVLKLLAWERGIGVLLVPPTSLKMFACGKGRADKAEVIKGVASTWGYAIPRDDEADAFVLLKMGEAQLSRRRPRKTAHIVALRGCALLGSRNCNQLQ